MQLTALNQLPLFYTRRSSSYFFPGIAHPDSIWSLSWTPLNHLITASASGHLRVYSPPDLQQPLYDLPVHSLGITSLSTSDDGRRAMAASLDGGVVMVDPSEGTILGRIETGREKVSDGESGE
jgi:WD repeat-containing protein 61